MKKLLMIGVAVTSLTAFAGAASAACPAITVSDMQGVAAGKYPQQFELATFEANADCKMEFSANPDPWQRPFACAV